MGVQPRSEWIGITLWAVLVVAMVGSPLGVRQAACGYSTISGEQNTMILEIGSIELVESVPIETTLDLPELRDTPEVWAEMISGAQQSIDIETFYFSGDPAATDRLDIILEQVAVASRRGVRIRALSDASFAETYPEIIAQLSAQQGTETQTLDARAEWGGVIHAKFFIVDDREFFVGSQNWDWRALEHIHELGVRIRHPKMAQALGAIFEHDWGRAKARTATVSDGDTIPVSRAEPLSSGPFKLVTPGGDTVQTILAASPRSALPPGIEWDETLLTQLVDKAQKTVRLHLLTFNPVDRSGEYHEALEAALKRAAARGVDVNVILSNWSKREQMAPYVTSLGLIPGITVRFTNIPEWSGGFIPYARVEHPKYLVSDTSACWIGTSNWTRGGFRTSRNISLFIRGPAIAADVARYFDNSWNSEYAEDVDPCTRYEPPRIGE